MTAFLTEMDGFVKDLSKPVFVLAATNFDVEPGTDKSLDPVLMRCFVRRVYTDLPNKEDNLARGMHVKYKVYSMGMITESLFDYPNDSEVYSEKLEKSYAEYKTIVSGQFEFK